MSTELPPSNPSYDGVTASRLRVERAWLYRPETEWTYSHHPHLAFFNGRYVAMWSNGRQDEDAPGQRVLYASSADFRAWTAPAPLLDSRPGKHSDLVLTAAGFHQHAETLVAYIACYEWRPELLASQDDLRRLATGHLTDEERRNLSAIWRRGVLWKYRPLHTKL